MNVQEFWDFAITPTMVERAKAQMEADRLEAERVFGPETVALLDKVEKLVRADMRRYSLENKR